MHQVQDSKLIKPQFILFTKENQIQTVEKLTPNSISKSKSIFYFENTQYLKKKKENHKLDLFYFDKFDQFQKLDKFNL